MLNTVGVTGIVIVCIHAISLTIVHSVEAIRKGIRQEFSIYLVIKSLF